MADGGATAGGAVEKWSIFTPRPLVQKSTSDLGSDGSSGGKLTMSVLSNI